MESPAEEGRRREERCWLQGRRGAWGWGRIGRSCTLGPPCSWVLCAASVPCVRKRKEEREKKEEKEGENVKKINLKIFVEKNKR
jgi:hypothetical protein